jgi:hypothetical protein
VVCDVGDTDSRRGEECIMVSGSLEVASVCVRYPLLTLMTAERKLGG